MHMKVCGGGLSSVHRKFNFMSSPPTIAYSFLPFLCLELKFRDTTTYVLLTLTGVQEKAAANSSDSVGKKKKQGEGHSESSRSQLSFDSKNEWSSL